MLIASSKVLQEVAASSKLAERIERQWRLNSLSTTSAPIHVDEVAEFAKSSLQTHKRPEGWFGMRQRPDEESSAKSPSFCWTVA